MADLWSKPFWFPNLTTPYGKFAEGQALPLGGASSITPIQVAWCHFFYRNAISGWLVWQKMNKFWWKKGIKKNHGNDGQITNQFRAGNIHCLNKRERPLHSDVTSKSKDQSTSFAKCPALFCSRQLVLVIKCYRQLSDSSLYNLAFLKNFRSISKKYLLQRC